MYLLLYYRQAHDCIMIWYIFTCHTIYMHTGMCVYYSYMYYVYYTCRPIH